VQGSAVRSRLRPLRDPLLAMRDTGETGSQPNQADPVCYGTKHPKCPYTVCKYSKSLTGSNEFRQNRNRNRNRNRNDKLAAAPSPAVPVDSIVFVGSFRLILYTNSLRQNRNRNRNDIKMGKKLGGLQVEA
jgi:hypothetical protein